MGIACRLDSLRSERIGAGRSVQRLAQLSGVAEATIHRLENIGFNGLNKGGTCSHSEADRICTALGISRGTAGFADIG